MERKPIFDAVRLLLGRGFDHSEVEALDRAIDRALAADPAVRRLGVLSEMFESGGRGAGAVSSGSGDPGGVSYGIWQLASRTGTAAAFMADEGSPWRAAFAGALPGSAAFSAMWRAVAAREPDAFAAAQHDFIERTHYRPAVATVLARTGCDLDARHAAVRDVAWSVAVQHGGAVAVLTNGVASADTAFARDDARYDRKLIGAVYDARTAYVLGVAARSSAAARATLESVTRNRYPAERVAALAMLDAGPDGEKA